MDTTKYQIKKQKKQRIKNQIKEKQEKQFKIARLKANKIWKQKLKDKEQANKINFLLTDNDLNEYEKKVMENTKRMEKIKAKQQQIKREMKEKQEKQKLINKRKLDQLFKEKKAKNDKPFNFLLD